MEYQQRPLRADQPLTNPRRVTRAQLGDVRHPQRRFLQAAAVQHTEHHARRHSGRNPSPGKGFGLVERWARQASNLRPTDYEVGWVLRCAPGLLTSGFPAPA